MLKIEQGAVRRTVTMNNLEMRENVVARTSRDKTFPPLWMKKIREVIF